jgi:cell division transport system permease protein
MARLVNLFRSIELVAGLLVALVGAAAVATVVFSARAGLSVHRDAIELLHLIGAQDRYVARQFGRQARDLGFVGGLGGLVFALLTLFFLGRMASGAASGLVPELSLALWHWVGLALLPVGAAVVTMLTAWLTVVRTLGRMM